VEEGEGAAERASHEGVDERTPKPIGAMMPAHMATISIRVATL